MRCMDELCPSHKRSTLLRTTGTVSLPASGLTTKQCSRCCELATVVRKSPRWRKQRRLADRVHRSARYRVTSPLVPAPQAMNVPQSSSRRFSFVFELSEPDGPAGTTNRREAIMNDWLPKSMLCLKSYTKRMFVGDLLAGVTVGLVALPLAMAFAIASGVPPQTGSVLRDCRGLRHLRAGRVFHPDWRADRRIRRRGLWHCRETRHGRTVHVHAAGWSAAADPGRDGFRYGGKVHTAAGSRGFHQRHCRHHRQHPDQGFLWTENRQGSR